MQALFGVVVLSGAFLTSSVWGPTAEAATTWDCQSFNALDYQNRVEILITNLSSDDRNVTVRWRDIDGDVHLEDSNEVAPGEGVEFAILNLGSTDVRRASVTAGTDKLKVTAWVAYFDNGDIIAARDVSRTRR
jgi:hypothetical protein